MRRFATRAFAVVFLLAVGSLFLPSLSWTGGVPRQVRLHVVDAKTSSPISNATVSFNGRAVGSTDTKGDLSWTTVFGAGGNTSTITRGHWIIRGEITVTDTSGHSTTVALPSLVPETRLTLWN